MADAVVRHVVTFGRVLREAGLEVGPGRLVDALSGLDHVDLTRQDDVYWTLRQTLVSRHDDLDAFDRAFRAWFLRAPTAPGPSESRACERCGSSGGRRRPRRGARRRATDGRGATRSGTAAEELLREQGLRRADAGGVRDVAPR